MKCGDYQQVGCAADFFAGGAMKDVEIVLCSMGTRGDIAPFVAMAMHLRAQGHKVHILSNSNWEALAHQSGTSSFHAIAPKDPSQSGRNDLGFFAENVVPSFQKTFDFIRGRVLAGAEVAVVYKVGMLGAQSAAENLGLLNIKVALQPSAVRSVERPRWPLTSLAHGWGGWLSKRTVIPVIYRLGELSNRYRRHANAFRESLSLSATSGWKTAHRCEDLMIMMCPEWFAMPQRDWPKCRMVGFPFLEDECLSDELATFLKRNDPPIVFTPGTGVTDVATFFARARELCAITQRPGVFLSSAIAPSSSSAMLSLPYADLGALLPKSSLLIHHGGIGTTAQALRAGIPQIVMPDRFDQPDNAMRVADLRCGAAVMSREVSASALAELLATVLGDEVVGKQVKLAARAIGVEDGARNAAELIHLLIQTRHAPEGVSGMPSPRLHHA